MHKEIFVKLNMIIIPLEAISTVYFVNPPMRKKYHYCNLQIFLGRTPIVVEFLY
jgi:hypothetical protein